MSRSSARKGQIEPLAALVAVSVLAFALVTYTSAVQVSMPEQTTREVAGPTLDAGLGKLLVGGLVRPTRLPQTVAVSPEGYRMNVTLATANRTWATGPNAPRRADRASRTVPVRVRPDVVRPGRISVAVWT